MIYPVTIKDKFGKVKKVISSKELREKHWSDFNIHHTFKLAPEVKYLPLTVTHNIH